MEKTFLMVKPDGVQRNLIGEIISRFELKGYTLVGAKLIQLTEDTAKDHYEEHEGKPFFHSLVAFITSGPVFAMVWEGEGIIAEARKMMGQTNPADSLPGTIRGDLGVNVSRNIIHGSDSLESAEREINLYFTKDELITYEKEMSKWI
ncbi:nucleoside-diphosphate kinase [Salipaludibacillus sp. LMS25]|jgi:nucleoside-diphosphate kinase|uniref:nucleoside-diphosphate kinase n=1 Tax=Salipaludibacillus sp. LMS25 TaxID=2924031 RepID=UPI0020D04BDA|nr:nucleoside-diphosphate kinase [Salipaludibacillus sp. LMS25]UTR14633.1 nucleoside-diphosphate kinase [Salipaludibacillus sp. LMS25]